MTKFKVDITGIEELKRALAHDTGAIRDSVSRAIVAIANDISNKADQLVPVDEGVLRSSRNLKVTKNTKGVDVAITYGGAAAPYAIVQHERLDFWHPPKPPGKSKVGNRQGTGPVPPGAGRGPKYLEHPFLQETADFADKIVRHVRAEFYGGKR